MNKFAYAKKDSYTQADMDSLLEQNTKFARSGYIEKTETLTKTLDEHKQMKEAAETAEFNKGLSEKLAKLGVTNTDKILKYGKFTKEMDDEKLKTAVESMKSDFPDSFGEKKEFKDSEFKTDTNEDGKQKQKISASPRDFGSGVLV